MLVVSSNVVLSEDGDGTILPDGIPIFLWENFAVFGTVTADSEDTNYPASNLTNPATNIGWRGSADSPVASTVEISVALSSPVQGVGIAGHNFGSTNASASVGYYDTSSPPVFVEIVGPQMPPTDEPMLFVFEEFEGSELVIRIIVGTEVPRASVLYVGPLLMCERSFDVGQDFTPPRFARRTDSVNGMSTRGHFLGRIITGQVLDGSQAIFKHFRPDWYRTYFDPFIEAAQRDTPFFFAWQPEDYPYEVALAWLNKDPVPVISPQTMRMHITLDMGAIVE